MEVAKIDVAPPILEEYENVYKRTMVEMKAKLCTIFKDDWR
jgi:hypothetical protein